MDTQKYTKEEVYEATLKYFNGDELATNVWMSKYALKDKDEMFLEKTPIDTQHRLASEFYKIEQNYPNSLSYDEIYDLLKDFKYVVPGGSVMEGAGTDKVQSLSNCFFNGQPNDEIESIMKIATSMAQIGKRRGGTSTDLSKLRPCGSAINNSAKESTGAVSFMKLYDVIGKIIGQNNRKMAMMITLNVEHPDIEEFITVKQNLTDITNANISIKLNNEFIEAVKTDSDYVLRFPCDTIIDSYEILDYNRLYQYGKVYVKKVKAKVIWDKLIQASHGFGEPGILNWTRVLDYEPTSVYEELKPYGTNPCSELPLGTLDSCRLICSNVYSFVENPFTENAYFDKAKAYDVFYKTQKLGDDIVDLEIDAVGRILDKIKEDVEKTDEFELWERVQDIGTKGRRTGCGITGLGDFYAALGLPYGDETVTEELFKIKFKAELNASIDMAKDRGKFPLYDHSKEYTVFGSNGRNSWYEFVKNEFSEEYDKMKYYGRRNSGISTIAPTGSLSILTQTTSGIEPVFMPIYKRRKKCALNEKADFIDVNGIKFKEFFVIHHKLKIYAMNKYLLSEYELENLTEEKWNEIYESSPYYKNIANELDIETRVRTQALIQKYISASISSTVNLPNNATVQDVDKVYTSAFDMGCKGITVYRDGCRAGVLVSSKQDDTIFNENNAPKRPKTLPCKIVRFNNNKERWIAAIGLLDGKPYEIFSGLSERLDIPGWLEDAFIVKVKLPISVTDEFTGKVKQKTVSRYDIQYLDKNGETVTVEGISNTFNEEYWNYAKLISGILRHGMPIDSVINVIDSLNLNSDNLLTWQNGIVRALRRFQKDGETGDVCPECGAKLWRENGCNLCKQCGFSGCN